MITPSSTLEEVMAEANSSNNQELYRSINGVLKTIQRLNARTTATIVLMGSRSVEPPAARVVAVGIKP